MLDYFIPFLLILAGAAVAGYFLIKWGAVCECECHDDNKFFKCDDSCECECHEEHIYRFKAKAVDFFNKYKTKVVDFFKDLYKKIKRK